MLTASALNIVIIISLVIATICSALVVTAYFYREQYQKTSRYIRLGNNLQSGENIVLGSSDDTFKTEHIISLYNTENDSIAIQTKSWGLYEIGIIKAFIATDTLFQAFSFAHCIDTSKWAALYLADQDLPLSVSGKTAINGNVFLPKMGVKKVFMNNKGFEGDSIL